MIWKDQLNNDPLPWLLETDDPGPRYLALRDLLGLPANDPEIVKARSAAHKEGPIAEVLNKMHPEGFWVKPGPGYSPKYYSTVWSLILLAQLGASVKEDPRIKIACQYLMDHALTPDSQFSASSGPGGTMDCLQGNLLWTLVELGYADLRMEKAFEWMAQSVTGEGIAPVKNRQAPVRYYAGKCGPFFACGANNKLPCAWGAAKVMLAFSKYPKEVHTPLVERAIQRGVDFFFSVDPVTAEYPCGYTNKPSQNWWKFGFPIFYVTDLLQVIEALVNLGYATDPRLANALKMILNKQDTLGRWSLEYDYSGKTWVDFGNKKLQNKWVTIRALRVLKAAYSI